MLRNTDQLIRTLASTASSNELCGVVRAALGILQQDPSQFHQNWHPLGFLQIKLGKGTHGHSVKLHIWPADVRKTQEPAWTIHRHEWELLSHVVFGSVENSVYTVFPADITHATNKLYNVTFDGSSSLMSDSATPVICELSSSLEYRTGQRYKVSVLDFHSTNVPLLEWACTIVISEPSARDFPVVVGELSGVENYVYERRPCEPDLFKEIMQHLHTVLS